VGDRIIPKNLEVSRDWMIKHSRREYSRTLLLEEREYLVGNPHERSLREIFEIAGAQYGRIDYAMKDGRVVTWEINYHPTIGRGLRESKHKLPAELDAIRDGSKECFYRGFAEAWESVDGSPDAPPVSVRFDPAILAAATARGSGGSALEGTRRAFRPFKALVEPLLRPVLPFVGRLVRSNRGR
jgi:hypothetical protein